MFNNRNFGGKAGALTDSLFFAHYQKSRPSPPPTEYLLVDDGGDFLLDDSGEFFAAG